MLLTLNGAIMIKRKLSIIAIVILTQVKRKIIEKWWWNCGDASGYYYESFNKYNLTE